MPPNTEIADEDDDRDQPNPDKHENVDHYNRRILAKTHDRILQILKNLSESSDSGSEFPQSDAIDEMLATHAVAVHGRQGEPSRGSGSDCHSTGTNSHFSRVAFSYKSSLAPQPNISMRIGFLTVLCLTQFSHHI